MDELSIDWLIGWLDIWVFLPDFLTFLGNCTKRKASEKEIESFRGSFFTFRSGLADDGRWILCTIHEKHARSHAPTAPTMARYDFYLGWSIVLWDVVGHAGWCQEEPGPSVGVQWPIGDRQRRLRYAGRGVHALLRGPASICLRWVFASPLSSWPIFLVILFQARVNRCFCPTGHQWLLQHLHQTPRHGFSIDPFGYSSSMPYLLKNLGFESIFIQRIHYVIRKRLVHAKASQFLWQQPWDAKNTEAMFTYMRCHSFLQKFLIKIPILSRGHFSPAPVKNRSCGTNPISQSSQSQLYRQSINQPKVYNESPRLIDWFNPPPEKLPHGDDLRVGSKGIFFVPVWWILNAFSFDSHLFMKYHYSHATLYDIKHTCGQDNSVSLL